MEKYLKTRSEELCEEIFAMCDLSSIGKIKKSDFLITVIFTQFYSLSQEIIEAVARSKENPVISNLLSSFGRCNSSSLAKFASSVSTCGTINDMLIRKETKPEEFVNSIYEQCSTTNEELTKTEFVSFLLSQPCIIARIKDSFRICSWLTISLKFVPLSKLSNCMQFSTQSYRATAKIFFHGSWVFRDLEIRDTFLLFFVDKRVLEQVMCLEGCLFKKREATCNLIYSTQYDERISLRFESPEECDKFSRYVTTTGKLRHFKEFYKLGEILGRGKFADVHTCTELANGSSWAVKLIHKRILDQSERELIRKELTIISCLNHSGVAKFKEMFESRRHVKVVMECVEGGDLLKKINSGIISENDIRTIIRQVLETIRYLHGIGVIHRDLKPENVLLTNTPDGYQVKLIDFGLSTYFLPNDVIDYCCGTLGYTAPEVFTGEYNSKIDLWSVGVITYAALSGKLPFISYIKEETIEMTKTLPVKFEGERWEQASAESKSFITCLLQKDPRLRPDSEEALRHEWLRCNLDV